MMIHKIRRDLDLLLEELDSGIIKTGTLKEIVSRIQSDLYFLEDRIDDHKSNLKDLIENVDKFKTRLTRP